MPRMFDILRGSGDNENIEGKKENPQEDVQNKPQDSQLKPVPKNIEKPVVPPVSYPKGIFKVEKKKKEIIKEEDASLVSQKLISAVKTHGVDDANKSKEIYDNAVKAVRILLQRIRIKEDISSSVDQIQGVLEDVFNQLVFGDSILDNIYIKKTEEYYLPHHITKVMILSSVIGMNMGFNKSRLNHLGLTAVFYDLGMDELRTIVDTPRKLSFEEFELVKTHISRSMEIVKKVDSIDDIVKEAVLMHHERINGKGYPHYASSTSINPYARIIGLIDTYESVTNDRAFREGMNGHKAIKYIIGSLRDYFDSDVMKAFINKMSIYPIGCVVRLDTQELAKVISVSPGSPLKPVVAVLQDASGEPVKKGSIIDLSKQDTPTILDTI
ncbi:MAG: HD domain-containing protein [Candidatus Omnitrophica bacterium]|nr:HD domain-containing protein [Candidatus Omnitrophota bacterium]